MEQISALIIDDDLECREHLQELLDLHCPDVAIRSTASNATKGKALIESMQPELVFLDIEMPDMDGFQLLESLQEVNFEVIFTTSHEKFALRAIKFAALDYLVKPVDPDDLKTAVENFQQKRSHPQPNAQWQTFLENMSLPDSQQRKIALPTGKGYQFVPLKSIYRMEAESNYVRIFLKDEDSMLVTQTLKSYEQLLKDYDFFRIHYSHMINLNYIKEYIRDDGGYIVMEDGAQLPIAKNRRKIFLQRIKHLV